MQKIISAFIAILAAAVTVAAQDAPLATITKVVKEEMVRTAGPVPQANSQMPKFLDDDARRGETFAVYWTATGRGLPPGATVLFEYVLESAPEIHALHIQYDFKTEGARKAVFTIPEKDYRDGGNVKAWRARVVRAGKLLAEQAAPNRATVSAAGEK